MALWIDDITIEVAGTVIRATAFSNGEETAYTMGRSSFRAYIERAIRQLNDADERDRCKVLRLRKAGH